MKIIKHYLTSEELSFIVETILEKDNALEREIVKIGLIAQIVCEDLGEYENCNDIYDIIVKENIQFKELINNYDIIDKVVNEELGVNKTIKDFVDNMQEKLNKSLDNFDIDDVIKKLGEVTKDSPKPTPKTRKVK